MQRRSLLTLATFSSLTACGFKLRGESGTFTFAFQSIFSGFSPASGIGQDFKRIATGYGLKVLDDAVSANTAQVVLRILDEQRRQEAENVRL